MSSTNPAAAGAMYPFHLEPPRRPASGSRSPIILFLHGAGESGGPLSKVQVHGPWARAHPSRALRALRDNARAAALIERFWIIAPHLQRRGERWQARRLLALLESLEQDHPGMGREPLIVTGLSRGGGGALRFAMAAPERVRALALFCPESVSHCAAGIARLAAVPTWIFHNAHERLRSTRPEQTAELFARLKRVSTAGARRTLFDASSHNCWRRVYESPFLYRWFLDPATWPRAPRTKAR